MLLYGILQFLMIGWLDLLVILEQIMGVYHPLEIKEDQVVPTMYHRMHGITGQMVLGLLQVQMMSALNVWQVLLGAY